MQLYFALAPVLIVLLAFTGPASCNDECSNCTTVDDNSTTNGTNDTDTTIPTPEPIVYERVLLRLYFPHASCGGGEGSEISRPDPLNVSLPSNVSSYTLQEVMEAATDQDESYQFSLLFFNYDYGYLLQGINGTEDEGYCKWKIYYQAPDELEPMQIAVGPGFEFMRLLRVEQIDNIEPNSTVIMCYQDTSPPPSPSPSPSPSPPPEVTTSAVVEPSPSSSQPPDPVASTDTGISDPPSSSAPSETPSTSPTIEPPEETVPTPEKGRSTSNFMINIYLTVAIITLCMYLV